MFYKEQLGAIQAQITVASLALSEAIDRLAAWGKVIPPLREADENMLNACSRIREALAELDKDQAAFTVAFPAPASEENK